MVTITFKQQCQTCTLHKVATNSCYLMPSMQGQITPTDFCSKHKSDLLTCEICGSGLLDPLIEIIEEKVHIYCDNCYKQRNFRTES